MARLWGISIDERERVELERIIMDEDEEGALEFLRCVIYSRVLESEKPGSCFYDVSKPVDDLKRPVKKHKDFGSFD